MYTNCMKSSNIFSNIKSAIYPVSTIKFSTFKKVIKEKRNLVFLKSKLKKSTSAVRLTPPWNVCFFGTDEYALTNLRNLHDHSKEKGSKLVNRLHVVVPKNGSCKVEEYAMSAGLECSRWNDFNTPHNFDVGVVVSFGHLIPNRIINAFPYGILNVHPSLLPRWRGASPIMHTILQGDLETGVSIMQIRPLHFDVGPILLQSRFTIPPHTTSFQLRDFLAQQGSQLLLQALTDLPTLERLEYEQCYDGVTYAHKLSATNARVNWLQQGVVDIDRQYRALSEIYDLRSRWKEHSIRLLDMVPLSQMPDITASLQPHLNNSNNTNNSNNNSMHQPAGTCSYLPSKEVLCVKCKDGWVAFKGIVHKKRMSPRCFYNGYLSKEPMHRISLQSLDNQLYKNVRSATVKKKKSLKCL